MNGPSLPRVSQPFPLPVRIAQARRLLNLPKARFASLLGVHRSAVSRWESPFDAARPGTPALERIARVTGVCFEWLATGRGPKLPEAGTHTMHEPLHEDFARCENEGHLLKGFQDRAPTQRRALLATLDGLLRGNR